MSLIISIVASLLKYLPAIKDAIHEISATIKAHEIAKAVAAADKTSDQAVADALAVHAADLTRLLPAAHRSAGNAANPPA